MPLIAFLGSAKSGFVLLLAHRGDGSCIPIRPKTSMLLDNPESGSEAGLLRPRLSAADDGSFGVSGQKIGTLR